MTTLTLVDLNNSELLDRSAMAELIGGDGWNLRSSTIVNGAWSVYKNSFIHPYGPVKHDGHDANWSYEGWIRTRTQTEYSYWDHFVTV